MIGALTNARNILEPFLTNDTSFEQLADCIKRHFSDEVHLQKLEDVEFANNNLGHIQQWFSMNDYSFQKMYSDIMKIKDTGKYISTLRMNPNGPSLELEYKLNEKTIIHLTEDQLNYFVR